jgi:hypothetical protein
MNISKDVTASQNTKKNEIRTERHKKEREENMRELNKNKRDLLDIVNETEPVSELVVV